jgi:F-type H+-transporting ATPase subunit a
VSVTASIAAASITAAAGGGGGFYTPGPSVFELPPVFGSVTKPMLLVVLSAVIIVGFMYASARKAAVVPSRLQYAGELTYDFVRNSIARENIGAEHFMKFVPYLFALFLFVLVNNYYGVIPFIQFPTFGRIGYVVPLALIAWCVYIGAGIWKHGVLGYLKHATMPQGVPMWIMPALVVLEFLSNILVRPFTLTLRLFGNMFAGHILLVLFATGGWYLMTTGNPLHFGAGIMSFVLGILVSFLKLIVMFLQAYVFTLLSAMYIGEAIADDH